MDNEPIWLLCKRISAFCRRMPISIVVSITNRASFILSFHFLPPTRFAPTFYCVRCIKGFFPPAIAHRFYSGNKRVMVVTRSLGYSPETNRKSGVTWTTINRMATDRVLRLLELISGGRSQREKYLMEKPTKSGLSIWYPKKWGDHAGAGHFLTND